MNKKCVSVQLTMDREEIKCPVMNIFYFCDEFSHSPRETL